MTELIISIIIPTFNREILIKETLESIIKQNSKNWECIVVDDGSSDSTEKVVNKFCEKYSKIKFFRREKHQKGASVCRNIGAKKAKGDYLVFLDSDDLIAKNFIEERIKWIENRRTEDFHVFPSCFFRSAPGDLNKLWNILYKDKSDLERFFDGDSPWHTSGSVWKRSSFLNMGGFYENALSMQDWEIHVRAIMYGLSYSKTPDNLKYLQHYIRKHNKHQISTGKLTIDRAINRLQTKKFVTSEFAKHCLIDSNVLRSLIGDSYRFALKIGKEGHKQQSEDCLKNLKDLGLVNFFLFLLLRISLKLDIIKNRSLKTISQKLVSFMLFRFFHLESIAFTKGRTKGHLFYNTSNQWK